MVRNNKLKAEEHLLPVPEGLKMRIKHINDPMVLEGFKRSQDKPAPRYATIAELRKIENDEVVIDHISFCSPKDSPSRKLGRIIAHNRCIKAYNKDQHQ